MSKTKNCSLCGKPCRGKVCRACIKANSKMSDTCYVCGAKVSPKARPSMCRRCSSKVVAEKLRDKNIYPEFLVCKNCGKHIPWKKGYKYAPVSFCSKACIMLYTHRSRKHTKDSLSKKIEDFIKEHDKYVSVSDICSGLKISEKSIYKNNICVKNLNEKHGLFLHAKKERPVKKDPHENLRERILLFIKDKGVYVPINVLLKEFHIDFYATWVNKFHFNIDELNRECGFVRTPQSYYEDRSFNILKDSFGEHQVVRQKRFSGCKGEKGWSLRYDFFVKSKNALIEIDGDQHHDSKNEFFRESQCINDKIKNEFAKKNNIRLYRIPISPKNTFYERLNTVIAQIRAFDKESELLET